MTSLFLGFFYAGWFLNNVRINSQDKDVLSVQATPIPTPLAIYEIENLASAEQKNGDFEIKDEINEENNYTSYLFEYKFYPNPGVDVKKSTTGQINIPVSSEDEHEKYPLVLMLRGYVDQTIYETGIGTSSGADYFAKSGFITVAPDFLGYASSDTQANNIFESRFQTYMTVLSLLKTIREDGLPGSAWNGEDIFIWAHSNGGQIALTALAATELSIPTTLWAPVTKPFPHSVLYYTDESIDGGKYIRSELAKFEQVYDVDKFGFNNYLDNINSPIQIHQGGSDDAIPIEWSNLFVEKMESAKKDIVYFTYPEADHNLRPDWDTVIQRDLEFFNSHLQEDGE